MRVSCSVTVDNGVRNPIGFQHTGRNTVLHVNSTFESVLPSNHPNAFHYYCVYRHTNFISAFSPF